MRPNMRPTEKTDLKGALRSLTVYLQKSLGVILLALVLAALPLPVLGLLPHGLAEPVAALALPFVGGHPFGHAVHYLAWENLKGVAISLTIGMAVDANVLIFERMREEVKNGRSTRDAAEAGFTEAWATIVDSNLTTLVAAFVLLYFGTGPVRGFAVTLAIGIATSMFTSVTVTRLIITG